MNVLVARVVQHLREARLAVLVLFTAIIVSGCAGLDPAQYANERPRLKLEEYFNGPITAWGLFQDRSGKVVRRFTVKMTGTWKGNTGVLEEDFVYSDGTTQRRVWTIEKQADGKYVGTADDVIGQAVGSAAGNALNWHYTLALPVGEKIYHVNLNDWMYQMDESVLINRAVMSKFGFRLGEVLITFVRDRDSS